MAGLTAVVAIAATPGNAGTATAELKDKNGKPMGAMTIRPSGAGALISLKLEGLPPGPHAVRFHDTGRCEGDFSSAGPILNPLGSKHGLLNEEGPMAGDLPNVVAGADGKVEAELLTPFVGLAKGDEATLLDDDGSALLIFEKPDDHLTDPDGAAGAPIACGVVTEGK
jgi:Cu-Zn family superoxide dismutase